MKRKIWSLTGVLAAVLAVGIVCLLQMGHLLPLWISWEHREILCTEEAAPETILLRNRSVSVRQAGKEIWRTQKDVKVQDVLWEDIDHDSEPELMLLCWKRGRYGESRPFWVTEDEKTWSQHIYLYDWKDGTFVPIWMASDIGREVICWSYDQRERLQLTDRDGETTAWDWVTWGLSRVPSTSVSFAAVGDNLIHRPIYDYGIRRENGNFDFLFENLRDELDRYDVTSINQETIYVEHPEDYSDYPRFGTPIEVGEAVIRAGFDMVSCATNHALDQGVDAIDRTVQLYEEAEVLCAGIQHSDDVEYRAYEVLERNGIRCAVFSYTQSTNGLPLPEDAPWSVHLLRDELQIRQDLLDYRAALTAERYRDAERQGETLRAQILKRDYSGTGTEDLDAQITELEAQLKALRSQVSGSIRRVRAGTSGLYSAVVDGYETILTPETLGTMTPSVLSAVKADDAVSSNVGKLVLGKEWYYVTAVSAEAASRLEKAEEELTRQGGSLVLRFAKGVERDLPVTISSVSNEENGRVVVVFQGDTYLSQLTLLREQSAQVIYGAVEGLRIPKEALHIVTKTEEKEDGTEAETRTTGVYCVVGLEADFKPVKILYTSDHFVVVEATPPADGEGQRLRPGEEIIVTARDLYDGKVIG